MGKVTFLALFMMSSTVLTLSTTPELLLKDFISDADLNEIADSASLQITLSNYLFDQADVNKNGALSFEEFSSVYIQLISAVFNINIQPQLASRAFRQFDFNAPDNAISRNEFTFLFSLNVVFAAKNLDLLRNGGGVGTDKILIAINNLIAQRDKAFAVAFKTLFDTDANQSLSVTELTNGLNKVGSIVGINLSFNPIILSNAFAYIAGYDQKVDSRELNGFLFALFNYLQGIFTALNQ